MIEVAVLWLFDSEGSVMLAQRAEHKRQDPGVWGPSVTGKLEQGETFLVALRRETSEELGLPPSAYDPDELLSVDYPHPDGETRRFHVFGAQVNRSIQHDLRLDASEVAGICWKTLEQTRELILAEPDSLVPSAGAIWPETFDKIAAILTD